MPFQNLLPIELDLGPVGHTLPDQFMAPARPFNISDTTGIVYHPTVKNGRVIVRAVDHGNPNYGYLPRQQALIPSEPGAHPVLPPPAPRPTLFEAPAPASPAPRLHLGPAHHWPLDRPTPVPLPAGALPDVRRFAPPQPAPPPRRICYGPVRVPEDYTVAEIPGALAAPALPHIPVPPIIRPEDFAQEDAIVRQVFADQVETFYHGEAARVIQLAENGRRHWLGPH